MSITPPRIFALPARQVPNLRPISSPAIHIINVTSEMISAQASADSKAADAKAAYQSSVSGVLDAAAGETAQANGELAKAGQNAQDADAALAAQEQISGPIPQDEIGAGYAFSKKIWK